MTPLPVKHINKKQTIMTYGACMQIENVSNSTEQELGSKIDINKHLIDF